jgi:hypothetical protein
MLTSANAHFVSAQFFSVGCIVTGSFMLMNAMRRHIAFSTAAVELPGQRITRNRKHGV